MSDAPVWKALRQHRTAVLAAGITVVFLLLAAGSLLTGIAVGSPRTNAAGVPVAPSIRPTPGSAASPTRVRTCSVAGQAVDARIPGLTGEVLEPSTGTVLWSRASTTPARPAQALEIVTAAAALSVLGSDYRIATTVVDDGNGQIALVGHGDATLSATPDGQDSVYQDAPKLADLAAQAIQAYQSAEPGKPITSVVLDDTYWSDSDAWDSTWPTSLLSQGVLSKVTALQVDGDRADPTQQVSARSSDPVAAAGTAFLAALHMADPGGVVDPAATASAGAASSAGALLATVQSQPLSVLVPQMLTQGDSTLAEMLARITSVQARQGGTAASLQAVEVAALAKYSVPTTGLTLRDGSGYDTADALPMSYLARLLGLVQTGGAGLDVIRDGLPIAGQTGSLAGVFTGTNAVARGAVAASPGAVAGVGSLAGTIVETDGTDLVFAFSADATSASAGSAALDTLTAAVYRCGDNLSNG